MNNDYINLISKQNELIDTLNSNILELVIANQNYHTNINKLCCTLDIYIDKNDNKINSKVNTCINKLEKIRYFYFKYKYRIEKEEK